jgi:putative hydrolase of the HAD superfamily
VSVTIPRPAAEPTEIRAVILDYGEVLCHLPSSQQIERLAGIFRMNPQSFLPVYLQSRRPYDRGDLLPAEYWDKFASQAGVKVEPRDLADLRRLDIEMWCHHNEPMIRWVEDLHTAGFRTAIMSNMPLDLAEHLRAHFAWMQYFDHHIFSAEVRSTKPEPAIYQRGIRVLGVEPSEVLLIDDREENLEGARTAGIRGLHFQSIPQLHKSLRDLGFTILPG